MSKPTRFDGLLRDLCVGLGFCGCTSVDGEARHVTRLLPTHGELTAKQFAELVLQAEWPGSYDEAGYEKLCKKWGGPIAERFVKHMGGHSVDASALRG